MSEYTGKPTVLVVDDEPRILEAMRDLLEDNFEVVSSTDAREALQVLSTATFAVILADQRMPGLTGDQFLVKARELSDATRILVTGYADISALIRAVNDGQIFTYVPKPWEPAELKVTVFKAAAHSRKMVEQKAAAATVVRQQEALAQSEAAFRRQTKILQSILDSMADGVIVVDENGHVLMLNPAAEQMVGPGARSTPRAQWSEIYGIYRPDTVTPYPSDELPLTRAMRGQLVDGVELYINNAYRTSGMFVSVTVRPLKDDGGSVKGGVAVVRDITAAKQSGDLLLRAKLDAERANHAKSEFLSRMSHELRTPLNSILGFAQILEMDDLEEDQRDSLAHIMKGGQHLLSLINEVLDLSRIEAGRLSLSPEPVQLDEVIHEAVAFVRPIAKQRNISIRSEATIDCDQHVKADRQRLRQVLLNLLSNAVKYNVEGGRIDILREERDSGQIRVSVSDTGSGILEKHQERLFQPFERMGDENMGIEGTGLGLALSRRLTEAMGGTMGVESKFGQGSTFWFELSPASQPEDDTPGLEANHDLQVIAGYSEPRTVLYVEDNPTNFTLMERIIGHKDGLRLIGATRGQSGLEMARIHRPDLILLDLHLPDIAGQEVLRQLMENPETAAIPIAIVSADATPGQIERLLDAGARSYLTKPLDVGSILRLFDQTFAPKDPVGTPESAGL